MKDTHYHIENIPFVVTYTASKSSRYALRGGWKTRHQLFNYEAVGLHGNRLSSCPRDCSRRPSSSTTALRKPVTTSTTATSTTQLVVHGEQFASLKDDKEARSVAVMEREKNFMIHSRPSPFCTSHGLPNLSKPMI